MFIYRQIQLYFEFIISNANAASTKAFGCFPHERLINKLDAYGFEIRSLRLIYDYLSKNYRLTLYI